LSPKIARVYFVFIHRNKKLLFLLFHTLSSFQNFQTRRNCQYSQHQTMSARTRRV
jgi:hypothetical protein